MSSPFQVFINNNPKTPTISNFLYLNIININLNRVGCIWWKYHIKSFICIFGLNLFSRNQLFNLIIVLFGRISNRWSCVLRAKKLVYAANNLTLSFGTALAISLMQIKNNNGPKTEP